MFSTYLALAKDDLAMYTADGLIVQPDVTYRVSSERNLFVVDGVGGHDLVWLEPFHQAESAKAANFASVHDKRVVFVTRQDIVKNKK